MFLSARNFTPVIWDDLQRPVSPNSYLLAPPRFTDAATDETAPIFRAPVKVLKQWWNAVIAQQPRIKNISESEDGLQIDYVQRTAFMRFPDCITVRFIYIDAKRTTLTIYSRSVYGYSDFGVNKARVQSWLAKLQDESAAA